MHNLKIIKEFPQDFIFGVATSSYQIEGSQYGQCGLSHWDVFAQKQNATYEFQNGSIACKHILNWQQDLDLIQKAGFSAYRFSFSWPRILPEGKGKINTEGISFYDKLIDGMLERKLSPFATLYHWDLPNKLATKGGWETKETSKWFADYSDLIMKKFGDRLYSIATINEPWCISWLSHYWGEHAPGKRDIGAAAKSMHNILLAHARSMEVIRSYGHKNAGIVLNKLFVEPFDESEKSKEVTELCDNIYNLWFDEALFNGKYPKTVLKIFEGNMPDNYEEDLKIINQPLDWIGLNYYTRSIIKPDPLEPHIGFKCINGNLDTTDMNWEIYPDGLYFLSKRLSKDYAPNLPIHITEIGMANKDTIFENQVIDKERVLFFSLHLSQIKKLIKEGIPVKSFFTWSLLDNFEWSYGYSKRFGIIHVDFKTQKRTPKLSWYEFKNNLTK